MVSSQISGALKRFRRTPWKFQQTSQTPLKSLPAFINVILSTLDQVETGMVTIDAIVFEPKHLLKLLAESGLPPDCDADVSFCARGQDEIKTLLHAAFSDWIDFAFVPTPKPFVIYADHDEYTTFFANTKSNLNRVVKVLEMGGFKSVRDYQREF